MNAINTMSNADSWCVNKIAVVGPGIVGMPMAALLAHSRICQGSDKPAQVVVIQRNSKNSGWKVGAINEGRSPIGGIEPDLDKIVRESVAAGTLRASHDYEEVGDADVILICVQTDKKGLEPDYGPLFEALGNIANALQNKPADKVPLIIVESTLAPSTVATVIKDHFAGCGLQEGRDILLGNSPNRVMPGRLVERVAISDKIVAGLNAGTPALIERLYSRIVTSGKLFPTNSLTAEIVKTLENAYRDVRIAYSTEIVRYCDEHDIDFYEVRRQVNTRLALLDNASSDPNAVPTGGLLIPMIGVGGHCLPKDGILLWWRKIESGLDTSKSLILESRRINDEAPGWTIRRAEQNFGDLSGKSVSLMGTAYRFNSEDTRNSPTLVLARQLIEKGCTVMMHDPYVKATDQNLIKFSMQPYFTRDISQAVASAEYLIFCTSHKIYAEERDSIIGMAPRLKGLFDGCNLYKQMDFTGKPFKYAGIGRGTTPPSGEFIDFVCDGFRVMERGVANELLGLIDFLNERYADDEFNKVDFKEVQRIADTCITGCSIPDPGHVEILPHFNGFASRLDQRAANGGLHIS
jgi:UDP-N-acetyl-D-mannosaminuronic acid dehydrogenase